MKNYSLKLKRSDVYSWKMLILFLISVYAQDTYSMYLYYVIVIALAIENAILFFKTKFYSKNRWSFCFAAMAIGITTVSFVLRRISWMEEMKVICYILILIDALVTYEKKPKAYENGMRLILGIIVISALYGIVEVITSYNIFEQYFIADYIRGYYGTTLYRIASIYMHPIVCGQIFLIGFWMVAFFYNSWKRTICLIVITVGIYYTKSRSIWGGLVFSIIVFGLSKVLEFFFKHRIKKRNLFYIPFVMICVFLLYKIGVFDTIINNIYARILAASGSTSELARQSMAMYTFSYMIHDAGVLQKICGYGMDSSKLWIYKSGAFVKAYDAIDNSYLTILYEFGIIGLLTIVFLFIRKGIECFFKKNDTNELSNVSVMAIVACVVPLYFYDFYGWLPVYIIFIYCVVASNTKNYIKKVKRNEKIVNI